MLKNKKLLLIVLQDLIFIFSTLLFFALPWSLRNYPMQHPINVFFVVISNTEGADSNTLNSILFGFVIPSLVVYIIYKIVIYILNKKNINFLKNKALKINLLYLATMVLICFTTLKMYIYPTLVYKIIKTPEYSVFYEQNYINPNTAKIKVPEKKRNLITLYVESLESSYASINDGGVFEDNLIPNLSKLAKENINFSHSEKIGGGENLEGTSWTVAGILSKMSGLPYFYPYKNINSTKTCLQNATILSDILAKSGYTQIFSMGSEKQFEDRDILLENHNVTVHDLNYYKDEKYIPQDYHVFWGIEDYKLFDIAKKELSELGKKNEPFSYSLLTVDSHYPSGFKCNKCEDIYDQKIKNVIRCTDNQVYDLVTWIQKQNWYSNTTIVILGDHCYLDAPLNNFIFYNVFINSAKELEYSKSKNRLFSSFDMYPTILESLGYEINEEGLALGRSLFSNSKTLLELYGTETITKETMKKNVQYEILK